MNKEIEVHSYSGMQLSKKKKKKKDGLLIHTITWVILTDIILSQRMK